VVDQANLRQLAGVTTSAAETAVVVHERDPLLAIIADPLVAIHSTHRSPARLAPAQPRAARSPHIAYNRSLVNEPDDSASIAPSYRHLNRCSRSPPLSGPRSSIPAARVAAVLAAR